MIFSFRSKSNNYGTVTFTDSLVVVFNKRRPIWSILCLFSSSFFAWNYFGLFFVISLAVFFNIFESALQLNFFKFVLHIFPSLVAIVLSATFWLFSVDPIKAVFAHIVSSLNMLLPIIAIYFLKKSMKISMPFVFVVLWLIYEMVNHYLFLSWPWLTFGNAMSNAHYFVQWVSFFGIYSVSGWLLTLGFMLNGIVKARKNKEKKNRLKRFILVLNFPILLSVIQYFLIPSHQDAPVKISVYIPENPNLKNIDKTRALYNYSKFNSTVDFILTPELFLKSVQLSSSLNRKHNFYFIDQVLLENPPATLVLGAEVKNHDGKLFNTIIFYNSMELFVKSKKKYIPVQEYTPSYLNLIFGKSFYELNIDDDQDEIISEYGVMPLLCYESLFSGFIQDNLQSSDLIFLLTSEDFMNNSIFGLQQYLNIIRLKAIESNRNIVKCSSGGISVVINEKGDVAEKVTSEFQIVNAYRINKLSLYTKINRLYEKVF